MKSLLKILTLVIAGMAFTGGFAFAQLQKEGRIANEYKFTGGADVVDGDTFYLSGGPLKIRLHGFDAPGAFDKNQPDSVKTYASMAKHALESLTQMGVYCGKKRGSSHDRAVHQCWANDTDKDLAAEMVRLGFGVDWPKFSKGEYADEEAEAQTSRRGIWQTEKHSWIE